MASISSLQPCNKCSKGRGQVLCGGCQQWFCVKHLLEHRQELSQQMDGVFLEHDELQQNLTQNENDRQNPLIRRIDQWELRSIERVKQIANEARQQLRESLNLSKNKIQESLHQITAELQENRQMESYTEIDLVKWTNQLKELREMFDNPSMSKIHHDNDEVSTTHLQLVQVRTHHQHRVPKYISNVTKWSMNGQTVAGGYGQGDALNQLKCPYGLDIDDNGTLFTADTDNHRVIRWKSNSTQGEMIAGGRGKGNRTDQLGGPLALLIDRINDCLIISDEGNRRIMRWSLDKDKAKRDEGEVINSNIRSFGLAMDDEGSLYVCDWEKHEVRRYGHGDGREGVIVAGGNGQGAALNQLNRPRNIFVDDDQSVYVSDMQNHRVIKWMRNAREGTVVVGGQGAGNSLKQLSYPSGIFVDRMGSVYVADPGNDRVMRWLKDAKQGEVIVGGNGRGSQNNQLHEPGIISFDHQGNLYIVDRNNHRIQRFDLKCHLEKKKI